MDEPIERASVHDGCTGVHLRTTIQKLERARFCAALFYDAMKFTIQLNFISLHLLTSIALYIYTNCIRILMNLPKMYE